MKQFFVWIEKRGLDLKDKVVISLTPRQHDPKGAWDGLQWPRRELTTLELGEVGSLYLALDRLILDNPAVFRGDGSLKPVRGRTTLVIEHDLNEPLSFTLPDTARIVSRDKKLLDPSLGR